MATRRSVRVPATMATGAVQPLPHYNKARERDPPAPLRRATHETATRLRRQTDECMGSAARPGMCVQGLPTRSERRSALEPRLRSTYNALRHRAARLTDAIVRTHAQLVAATAAAAPEDGGAEVDELEVAVTALAGRLETAQMLQRELKRRERQTELSMANVRARHDRVSKLVARQADVLRRLPRSDLHCSVVPTTLPEPANGRYRSSTQMHVSKKGRIWHEFDGVIRDGRELLKTAPCRVAPSAAASPCADIATQDDVCQHAIPGRAHEELMGQCMVAAAASNPSVPASKMPCGEKDQSVDEAGTILVTAKGSGTCDMAAARINVCSTTELVAVADTSFARKQSAAAAERRSLDYMLVRPPRPEKLKAVRTMD